MAKLPPLVKFLPSLSEAEKLRGGGQNRFILDKKGKLVGFRSPETGRVRKIQPIEPFVPPPTQPPVAPPAPTFEVGQEVIVGEKRATVQRTEPLAVRFADTTVDVGINPSLARPVPAPPIPHPPTPPVRRPTVQPPPLPVIEAELPAEARFAPQTIEETQRLLQEGKITEQEAAQFEARRPSLLPDIEGIKAALTTPGVLRGRLGPGDIAQAALQTGLVDLGTDLVLTVPGIVLKELATRLGVDIPSGGDIAMAAINLAAKIEKLDEVFGEGFIDGLIVATSQVGVGPALAQLRAGVQALRAARPITAVGRAAERVVEPLARVTARPAEALEAPIVAGRRPVPTRPPTAPPPRVPTEAPPPPVLPESVVPPPTPWDLNKSLSIGRRMVEENQPSVVGKIADIMPVTKQLRGFVAPGTQMPDSLRAAWVGQSATTSALATEMAPTRLSFLQQIDDLFGSGAAKGGKSDLAKFIGSQAERVPITGTFLDIAQRPSLYELTAAQKALIQLGQGRNASLVGRVNVGFRAGKNPSLRIREFPVEEGGMHLPNVDVSEAVLEVYGGSVSQAAVVGRGKPRLFKNAAERMRADATFKPETNIETLLTGMDAYRTGVASRMTFLEGSGGLTRLEVMQIVLPKLHDKMLGLRTRLQSLRGSLGRLEARTAEAIDEFLGSSLETTDLAAVRNALDIRITRGKRAGATVRTLQRQIDGVRKEIANIQPAWKAANLKGYSFVGEGVFRYFPLDEAKQVRQLLEVSSNRWLTVMEGIRNISFNFDLSPMTGVHLPLAAFADPWGVGKQFIQGLEGVVATRQPLRGFSARAMARDVGDDLLGWQEFAAITGRPVVGPTPIEFSGGLLNRIPGYKPANEAMWTLITRVTKRMYDDFASSLEKSGISHDKAIVAAGDQVGKAVPLWNPRLLGLSQARQKQFRSLTISPSFVLRPAELTAEAARGYIKLGLLQTLTPKERLAVQMMTNIVGTVSLISVMTNVLYAHHQGLDKTEALKDAVNPNSPFFMSVRLPNGDKVSLGGPFRSFIRLIAPSEVKGSPVPLPFANVAQWATGRMTPALRAQFDLVRNKDFYGNRIVSGEFPENILRGLAYEVEGVLPLIARGAISGLRTGLDPSSIKAEVISQFLGVNLAEQTPFQRRHEAAELWAKEQGIEGVTNYYDLTGVQRQEFQADQPDVVAAIKKETDRRAQMGDPFAIRQKAKDEEFAGQLLRDQALESGLLNGRPYDATQWKADYYNAQQQSVGARQMYERLQSPTYREPETPEEKALDEYYKLMQTFQLPAGQFDGAGWEVAEGQYLAGLTDTERTYLVERLRPNLTPKSREFSVDRELLAPYWEVGRELSTAAIWQQYLDARGPERRRLLEEQPELSQLVKGQSRLRLQMRREEILIDSLLNKWDYVSRPMPGRTEIQLENVLEERQEPSDFLERIREAAGVSEPQPFLERIREAAGVP